VSDKLYREWIQTLPSCLTNDFSEYLEDGRKLCVAAHIRRAGHSGVAFKAPFSCVPLRQDQHTYQHNHGELACLRKFIRDPQLIRDLDNASPFEAERIAGEWFDAEVEKYRREWQQQAGPKSLPQALCVPLIAEEVASE
jgi:hypothetical protein